MNKKPGSKTIFDYLELFTEVLAWVSIVVSLSFLSAVLGFFIHFFIGGKAGIYVGFGVLIIGFFVSILFACHIWRTKGTVNFISNSAWKRNKIKNYD